MYINKYIYIKYIKSVVFECIFNRNSVGAHTFATAAAASAAARGGGSPARRSHATVFRQLAGKSVRSRPHYLTLGQIEFIKSFSRFTA